jgi:hypothetical protein
MLKTNLFILFILFVHFAAAQDGRSELAIDTLSIGGKEQDMKTTQLEGFSDLLEDLTAVRDSLSAVDINNTQATPAESRNGQANHIPTYIEQMDGLIRDMKKTEFDADLMKRGYDLLDKVRRPQD